ncbi:MAG TPA: hypothetical protein ENN67_08110, partial [Firmicutes bacterium]|nr:hypothetical protein [Bacillota bacterium]
MNIKTSIRIAFIVAVCAVIAVSHQSQASGYQTLNTGWLLETAKNVILTSEPWKSSGCKVEISSVPSDITVYRDGRIEVVGILERTPNGLRDIGAVSVEVYV